MKSYDVVGYTNTESGYCVCLDCVTKTEKEEFCPIFADSEWDAYPSCDRCSKTIENVCLTEEGMKYYEGKSGNNA